MAEPCSYSEDNRASNSNGDAIPAAVVLIRPPVGQQSHLCDVVT